MTQFASNAQDSETFSLYAGIRQAELNAQDWCSMPLPHRRDAARAALSQGGRGGSPGGTFQPRPRQSMPAVFQSMAMAARPRSRSTR